MELQEPLLETLKLIPKTGATTAHKLAARIHGVSSNAQNNRLERLRKLGFLTRHREGKFWMYSRA